MFSERWNLKLAIVAKQIILIWWKLQSYATVRLKCDAGLMITASHNPKQDNGYKAYWTNGAQVNSITIKRNKRLIGEIWIFLDMKKLLNLEIGV